MKQFSQRSKIAMVSTFAAVYFSYDKPRDVNIYHVPCITLKEILRSHTIAVILHYSLNLLMAVEQCIISFLQYRYSTYRYFIKCVWEANVGN